MHLDGARLLNAAAYLDVPLAEICRHVDSVWFALCKGLGGPVGALLAGDTAFMMRARRAAKMLGGGMRQAGLIAAPAIVALRDPYPLLKRDHELAGELARGLAAIDPSLVDVGACADQHRQLLRRRVCRRCGPHRPRPARARHSRQQQASQDPVRHPLPHR